MDLLIARMEDPKFKMGSPLRKHSDPLEKPHFKTKSDFQQNENENTNNSETLFKGFNLKQRGSDTDPKSNEAEPSSLTTTTTTTVNNTLNAWKDDFDKYKVDFKNFRIRYKNPENMHSSGNSGLKRSSLPVNSNSTLEVNSVNGNRKRSLPIDSTFKDTTGLMDDVPQSPRDGSRDSIGPNMDDPNYTLPKTDWASPLPDFGRSASPTLRERRMSGFPELDKAVSPITKIGRRGSMWTGSRNTSASSGETSNIIRPEPETSWRFHSNSGGGSRPRSPQMGDRRASMLPVLEDFAIQTAQEEGELDPNTPEPYRPASPQLRERRNSGFPELDRSASPQLRERRNSGFPELERSASPQLRERRMSCFPELDRARSTSPVFDDRKRRQSKLSEIENDNLSLRGRSFSMYSERSRSRSPSSTSSSPIRWQRRNTMIPELERHKPHPPVQPQMRRRKSMFPEVKTVDNNAAKTKNRFKTFDFKSFQFPLSEPGETIIEEEDQLDDIPGRSKTKNVIREEKVNRNNGKNKVRTIEDNNDYDDVKGIGHVKNIFTALIQQEKERDKEREKHHHHVHHGITDYTSATTGTFSDVMFNYNEKPNGTQSQSQSNSNSGSCSSLFMAGDNNSQNETITSKEATGETTMGTTTPGTTALGSSRQTPVMNKILGIDGKNTHRHHKSLSADSKGTSFVNDKKRLVYQFLESMAPPSKNQLQKQGLLFTSESPLISSHSFAKSSGPLGNGVGISSNKSLQSLLFHDLEHPESINNHSRPSSPYSKSSYSLSSYSSTSSSSTSSSSLSGSSYSDSYEEESSTNKNEEQMEDLLDRYEVDYYQQHIALLLAKFDDIMKTHLKDAILKKETDFQKSLQTFDKLVLDLQTLKQKTIDLKALIKDTYMVKLDKDFKEDDNQSFISNLQANVGQNIKQLESFESRMKKCQDKLVEQKEELKRMENLLQIEQSIIESKKSLGFFSKYRYVILDIFSLFLIVFMVLIFTYPLSSKVKFTKKNPSVIV
ncbi:hypothetical protein MOUN0_F05204 [Monosporozyma unispora]